MSTMAHGATIMQNERNNTLPPRQHNHLNSKWWDELALTSSCYLPLPTDHNSWHMLAFYLGLKIYVIPGLVSAAVSY